ncbi:50S ribosomal protein L32 [Bifidobacterium catenulatum]|uniref:50S ribosomal protein L32 n=1 Tax=Bifidobacterium catenulatum TaxID=1686 RepID=UPI00248104C4|nr:50S ribosomal protein L32 [Bifidobacterium catenulatum]MDH7872813.1 50S ribosomal protein L32 [Bifidobacterium catenulatum subsp. kashiwanohense]MDH7887616.1 50S ribosomal protein L32 [Bifidobacterium catenulatum subsp. kashiwanohense]
MALPETRTSRANTHSRRSNWKAKPVDLVTTTTPDGRKVQVPGYLVPAVRKGYVDVDKL